MKDPQWMDGNDLDDRFGQPLDVFDRADEAYDRLNED